MAAMTSETLRHEAAGRLRQAVEREAYDDTQLALADYRRHVEEALAAWPQDGPPPAELARETDELMQWALLVARTARARTRHQLEHVTAILRYCQPFPQVRAWKIDG